MANVFDASGLTFSTRQEWVDFFTTKYREIYGADINLSSDTPDGQMMNIMIQVLLDQQDLMLAIYNSFDPDNAIGVTLDQRVAINGIQRQEGTYTLTNVTVTNAQSVNLYGLDGATITPDVRDDGQEIYTVADNAGNRWFLQVSQVGLSIGAHVLEFRAENPGQVLTVPNTITVPITVVLGVTSVNNPDAYTTLGQNEETDGQLKVRRAQSVSLASQGYLPGLLAALENIDGVTAAFVYENDTDTTDSDGVPSHTIWVIVAGTAEDADIANAIYTKRNAGCGMFGDTSYIVTQVDGSPFIIRWDEAITRNLFVTFTVTSINGVTEPNVEAIRDGLPALFIPDVYEEVNINALATAVQTIDANTLVTNAGFSDGSIQTLAFSGVAASGTFKIKYDGVESAAINWNDAVGTIQTKVQGITGLTAATVTGSIASQSLVVNLSNIGNVLGLLSITSNTLATSGPVAITVATNLTITPTLEPASKQFQFVLTSDNIVITPMELTPSTSQVAVTAQQTFTGFGGYGSYVYSISVNNSGASINASTGVYTAGSTPLVSDTVKVTDSLGNTATATVSVV